METEFRLKIIAVKATYRFHKEIAVKLQTAIDLGDYNVISPKIIETLLTQLGMHRGQLTEALQIARDWHFNQFLKLIFQHYSPTLTRESGIELDKWVQSQIDNNAFTLLGDCHVPTQGVYSLKKLIQFDQIGKRSSVNRVN